MKYGFARVAAASPELRVADCSFNSGKIIEIIHEAEKQSVEFLVFPELCLTGSTCGDLLLQGTLLEGAKQALSEVVQASGSSDIIVMVGLPLNIKGCLCNCAAVIQGGKVLGVVQKSNAHCYNGLHESRLFTETEQLEFSEFKLGEETIPIGAGLIFVSRNDENLAFGIEIGEDALLSVPASASPAQAGAILMFNLSADTELVGKADFRKRLIENESARWASCYVHASSNCGESSTDQVCGGHLIIAENGDILKESDRFYFENKMIVTDVDVDRLFFNRFNIDTLKGRKAGLSYRRIYFDGPQKTDFYGELMRQIDKHPFVPQNDRFRYKRCHEILSIQTAGLEKRLRHTGIEKAVIGISGGLDSTLAFIVSVRAMERMGLPIANIQAITMPGFGTTGRTYDNAVNLINNQGASLKVVDIKSACLKHFENIGHDANQHDVTYENVQARERTQILMDIANKNKGLVVGTGDLSELALGWCTYNGDHMSMYGVNSGVPKTLIRYIIRWYADNEASGTIKKILYDIIDTPISPELLPPSSTGEILQKTEEILGPYEVHDFFLYNMHRCGTGPTKMNFLVQKAFEGDYSGEQLKKWLKVFYQRFFSQQFKRSCMPDGPKVGTVSLSPRGDWKMPSDASAQLWLSELENCP